METKLYTPILSIMMLIVATTNAQTDFSTQFEPVHQELVKWDAVRGEWLSQSMTAMAQNHRTPDRMFPEDYTPSEMYASLPSQTQTDISRLAATNNQSLEWNRVNNFISRSGCKPVQGRSYGDPHLSSFDGANYSFQTVGEFLLVQSASNNMEIQVRQRPQRDDFSLNTAAAMMVSGDRVAFYANELPDANSSTRIRLNGEALYMDKPTYYLPHGGVIRQEADRNYRVVWPTGESAKIVMHTGAMGYLDMAVEIYPCADQYVGVLGNANGNKNDDFDTRGPSSRPVGMVYHDFGSSQVSNEMEKEYLAWMARDFAQSWRVTNETTLFDYGFNENTMTYTDYSFPRVHHTINDMASVDRDRARRACQAAGVTGSDLAGCIYDGGYLNIPPTPRTPISNPTPGRDFKPIRKPEPNVNTGGTVTSSPVPAIRREKPLPVTGSSSSGNNNNGALPIDKPITKEANGSTPAVNVVKETHPISSSTPGNTTSAGKNTEVSGSTPSVSTPSVSTTPSIPKTPTVSSGNNTGSSSGSTSTPVSIPSSRPSVSFPTQTKTPSTPSSGTVHSTPPPSVVKPTTVTPVFRKP